jgi:hypothetical protein
MIRLFLLLAFLTPAAEAAPRILHGDWQVGGSLNFSYYDTEVRIGGIPNVKGALSVSGDGQYFFADGFSAGLELGFSARGDYRNFTVGPVVTKYIRVNDNLAPYISLLPILVDTNQGDLPPSYSTIARVGAKYFVTDSVAFGPALEYQRFWETDRRIPSLSIFRFLALFSIHL